MLRTQGRSADLYFSTDIAKVSSRCLLRFLAIILVYHGCTQTWRFHTGLCKFLLKIATNIQRLGKRTRLKVPMK